MFECWPVSISMNNSLGFNCSMVQIKINWYQQLRWKCMACNIAAVVFCKGKIMGSFRLLLSGTETRLSGPQSTAIPPPCKGYSCIVSFRFFQKKKWLGGRSRLLTILFSDISCTVAQTLQQSVPQHYLPRSIQSVILQLLSGSWRNSKYH
jgi:hypothetical protein